MTTVGSVAKSAKPRRPADDWIKRLGSLPLMTPVHTDIQAAAYAVWR